MVETLAPHHVQTMAFQVSQAYVTDFAKQSEYVEFVCNCGAFAAVRDGEVIAIGGILKIWEWRAQMWSLLSPSASRHMLALTRIGRRMLDVCNVPRIEASTGVGNKAEGRWLEMLGFELETPVMRKFGYGMRDEAMYVRIK